MEELKDFHSRIGELFSKRKIPALSVVFDTERIHDWSDRLCQHFRCDADAISRACSNIYWAFAEMQLATGHCLWIIETETLTLGYSKENKQAQPPQINLADIYYWYYVSCVWEMIYRSWERQALLLQLVFFGEDKNPHYNTVLYNLEERFPRISSMSTFQALKKKIKKWNNVAKRRNKLSHQHSIVFSYLDTEYRERPIIGPEGQPLYYELTNFPDPKRELDRIVQYYKETSEILIKVHDFTEECISKKVGTPSIILP